MNPTTILQEADRFAGQESEPSKSMSVRTLKVITNFWQNYLTAKFPDSSPTITPEDVLKLLALRKIGIDLVNPDQEPTNLKPIAYLARAGAPIKDPTLEPPTNE